MLVIRTKVRPEFRAGEEANWLLASKRKAVGETKPTENNVVKAESEVTTFEFFFFSWLGDRRFTPSLSSRPRFPFPKTSPFPSPCSDAYLVRLFVYSSSSLVA